MSGREWTPSRGFLPPLTQPVSSDGRGSTVPAVLPLRWWLVLALPVVGLALLLVQPEIDLAWEHQATRYLEVVDRLYNGRPTRSRRGWSTGVPHSPASRPSGSDRDPVCAWRR